MPEYSHLASATRLMASESSSTLSLTVGQGIGVAGAMQHPVLCLWPRGDKGLGAGSKCRIWLEKDA